MRRSFWEPGRLRKPKSVVRGPGHLRYTPVQCVCVQTFDACAYLGPKKRRARACVCVVRSTMSLLVFSIFHASAIAGKNRAQTAQVLTAHSEDIPKTHRISGLITLPLPSNRRIS